MLSLWDPVSCGSTFKLPTRLFNECSCGIVCLRFRSLLLPAPFSLGDCRRKWSCLSISTKFGGSKLLSSAPNRGRERHMVSKKLSDDEFLLMESSKFPICGEDPMVAKLRTQLGFFHPIPSLPINRAIACSFVLFFFIGVLFEKLWISKTSKDTRKAREGMFPQVPASLSRFLEKDLNRKESVEWVNMVLGKLWKVYRPGIDNWIIGFLQPVIDNLQKPGYVQRVEIKQFSLGDDPLSVRNVERRTSRRATDLQYHIGLRYTGGARVLLSLSMKFGIFPFAVPVGARDFDVDGELWVKLRLIQTEPYVGAVSWAFVSMPKIKFELSPFRLFNLMGVPVVSMFLRKLLTEDLPGLFVRPRKIVLDFQKGKALGPVTNNFKVDTTEEHSKAFVGELSVTLVDARKLAFMRIGKTDPYVVLRLGDQELRSKKNSQTTVIGLPGEPIWNQDFLLFVANPRKQRLKIEVIDSFGFSDFTLGKGEVELGSLQDTVPTDRIVALQGGWRLFGRQFSGEILLRLTYKAYVEDEDDDEQVEREAEKDSSDDETSIYDQANDISGNRDSSPSYTGERDSFMNVLAALLVSEEFQGIVTSETGYPKSSNESDYPGSTANISPPKPPTAPKNSNGSALIWLVVITSLALLIAFNVASSGFFNP